ncbi:MAG: ABC transporter ATP-binding protein [Dehalococcoidia bacterium]|nr:ABC transporter ATP-binding protein [Dehalococcoidia bacterium]MDW8120184.1 ATP-binding cassette domain-containing protein [Chloroflexota bacterium]
MMVEVKDLTKYYGNFMAIEGVSFTVRKGDILGFLGPNGSGKTTTMRIATGYIPPTSGTVRIAGYDIQSQSLEARRRIGYLPETVPLYTDMTVEDYLEFMGTIRGMPKKRLRQRINEVIDIVKIHEYRSTHIAKLSKGYRQRTGLAQAILHEPEVLILDEPTIGIDPIQVVETRSLIRELGKEHTIILSTHILPEVSMVCNRVVIIHEGRVVAEDTPANLAERLKGTERIELEVRGPAKEVMPLLRGMRGVMDVRRIGEGEPATYIVESRRGADLREQIAQAIVSKGWGLLKLNPASISLEEIFLRLTVQEEEA